MAAFKTSFAAARKAGKKTFMWEGKSYTTKLKSEGTSKAAPKNVPVPQSKPKQGTGSTAKSGPTGEARVPKPSSRPSISTGSTPKSGNTKPTSPKASPKPVTYVDNDNKPVKSKPAGPNYGIVKPNSAMGKLIAKRFLAKQAPKPKGSGGGGGL